MILVEARYPASSSTGLSVQGNAYRQRVEARRSRCGPELDQPVDASRSAPSVTAPSRLGVVPSSVPRPGTRAPGTTGSRMPNVGMRQAVELLAHALRRVYEPGHLAGERARAASPSQHRGPSMPKAACGTQSLVDRSVRSRPLRQAVARRRSAASAIQPGRSQRDRPLRLPARTASSSSSSETHPMSQERPAERTPVSAQSGCSTRAERPSNCGEALQKPQQPRSGTSRPDEAISRTTCARTGTARR